MAKNKNKNKQQQKPKKFNISLQENAIKTILNVDVVTDTQLESQQSRPKAKELL